MADLKALYQAVLEGDAKTSAAVTKQALDEGTAAMSLVTDAMIPAMDQAGKLYEEEEYFVPELLLSARAMKAAMELIRPLLASSGVRPSATIVIGTVKGDLHDIGKNLVAAMLEGGGFEVIDLGADVNPESFIGAIEQQGAQVVCLSALLTVTMPSMKKTIDALVKAGVRQRVKVLVGGAPVTKQFAEEIGADGFAPNANGAVALVRQVVASGRAA